MREVDIGVAVSNVIEEMADVVIDSNDDGGARYIEKTFFKYKSTRFCLVDFFIAKSLKNDN